MSQTTPPPLTSTFTPAPSCFSDIYIWNNTQGLNCVVGKSTQTCRLNSLGPPNPHDCLPPGFNSSPQFYFSPGVCPSGYSIACSTVASIGTLSETRATCCPSGLICQTKSDWPWYSTEPCTYGASFVETWAWTSSTDGGWTMGTSTALKGLNAYGISIRWQSTDFASAATATSIPRSSPGATVSADQATSTSPATADPSSGLSTGSKAGIGVGVGVAALLFIAIVCVLFRYRRRHAAVSVNSANTQGATLRHNPSGLWELPAGEAARELDSGPGTSEIDGSTSRAELATH
ncbi:hypothetical protein BDV23DRAFT_138498 [Aspergillus alliaceus]|uniref:Mid2 domain-containing protein n=1 Tax=Petromyces alliaceus TaxID=209559 RepID=A0A5N7BYJ0_PETAA|nr:hypothetical protein BDV23DRAFT_138498 [Aspergillus alliaceus]